jgi:methionyl-tRNA formyltransferase
MSIGSNDIEVLLLRKDEHAQAEKVEQFLGGLFPKFTVFRGSKDDKLSPEVLNWQGDLLISFVTPWIYPETLLQRARLAAINFHPGPPEYPGTGCTNFAIYDNAAEYGVTCHHMLSTVDSGSIIAVDRFPMKPGISVFDLTQQSYDHLEAMVYRLIREFLETGSFPQTEDIWTRKPYTRKELNELCEIRPDMTSEEVNRRIHATTFIRPWAYTRIGDHVFRLVD